MRYYRLKIKDIGETTLFADEIKFNYGKISLYKNKIKIIETSLDTFIEDITDICETYTTAQNKTHIVRNNQRNDFDEIIKQYEIALQFVESNKQDKFTKRAKKYIFNILLNKISKL